MFQLSVWGGPLRLQATQQQTDKERHLLKRIILHPVLWMKELDEWQHMTSFGKFLHLRKGTSSAGNNHAKREGSRGFAFPSTWLPLRWLQIVAVAKAFSTDPLKYRWTPSEDANIVIPRLMKQYLVQLALGDEWRRVFLIEKRVGLGIIVVLSYFVALIFMVFTAFTLDGRAGTMLIPSIFAAVISAFMNIMIFWNRLGTKEQAEWSESLGFAQRP